MSEFNFNWKGKRVLITGHTGFKGTWLCLWMQLLSAQVHGYARVPPTRPNLHELADAGADMEATVGDIRDMDLLQATFERVQPEIVFHLAAQPIVQLAYEDPVETFSTNMMGTVNVLECARQTPSVKSIVVVTSDKCYTNHEWHWAYREKSTARRPRPLRREQELRGAHRALLSRVVFQPGGERQADRPRGLGARRQRHRRRRLGAPSPGPRHHLDAARRPAARPAPPESDPPLAARSRAAARLSAGRRAPLQRRPPERPVPGTSVRSTKTACPSPGWRKSSPASGARGALGG